jgi:hypothetical protein
LPQLAQLLHGAAQILRDHASRYCFVFRLLALLVRTTALRLGPSAITAAHGLASLSSTSNISGTNADLYSAAHAALRGLMQVPAA